MHPIDRERARYNIVRFVGLVFDHQIFIEEKPSFYAFANETKNMTGEEVFALFAAPERKGRG